MTETAYREYCREQTLKYKAKGCSLQECFKKLNEDLIEKELPPNKYATIRNYYYRPVRNIC